MAYRLKFSARALRETGEAQEWYESQSSGLGDEFIAALELQLKRLEQAPLLYAEVIPNVRRITPAFSIRRVLCSARRFSTCVGCSA